MQIKADYVSFTPKGKKILKKKQLRLSTDERIEMEKNFEVFWKAYPKKVGKKRAKFEWMRIRPNKKLADKIIKAIDVQIKYKSKEERRGNFVPEFQHPERWLKHARYEDEYVSGTNYLPPKQSREQRDER